MIHMKTKEFWTASAALGAASILAFGNIYAPQPLLPLFTDEFGISETASSLTISAALIVLSLSFFLYTALSDSYGRRVVLFTAMGLGTLGTIALIFAPTFEWLLLGRLFQAAGLAGIPVAAMAYISEEYDRKALTLAMGIYISCNSFGGMSGRLVTGAVTDWWDWRGAFVALAILSILLSLAVWLLLPESRHFEPQPFRLKTVMAANKEHLANPVMVFAYIVGGVHFLVFIGIFNFITYYLHGAPFHASTIVLGFLFLTYSAGTVSSSLAGKMAQRIDHTTGIFIGIGLMALSLAATLVPSFPVIILALIVLCFGFFFSHSILSSWVSGHAVKAKASASGLYLSSYYLGGGLGSLYFGWLWPAFGWTGVIAGALVLLATTSVVTGLLRKADRRASVAVY